MHPKFVKFLITSCAGVIVVNNLPRRWSTGPPVHWTSAKENAQWAGEADRALPSYEVVCGEDCSCRNRGEAEG